MIYDVTTLSFCPSVGEEIFLINEGKPVAKIRCVEAVEGEDGCKNCYYYQTSNCGHVMNNMSPFVCHRLDRADEKNVRYELVDEY